MHIQQAEVHVVAPREDEVKAKKVVIQVWACSLHEDAEGESHSSFLFVQHSKQQPLQEICASVMQREILQFYLSDI